MQTIMALRVQEPAKEIIIPTILLLRAAQDRDLMEVLLPADQELVLMMQIADVKL